MLTNRQTDKQTHRTTTVTLAAHARRGLIIVQRIYSVIFKKSVRIRSPVCGNAMAIQRMSDPPATSLSVIHNNGERSEPPYALNVSPCLPVCHPVRVYLYISSVCTVLLVPQEHPRFIDVSRLICSRAYIVVIVMVRKLFPIRNTLFWGSIGI